MRLKKSLARRGFTLIELVVVLMIIAVIAGLVVPQVAMMGRSADMAASAKTQADLTNNIQLHFVQLKRYPQGMDSLLTTDGDIYAPMDAADNVLTSSSDEPIQVKGLPVNGSQGTHMAAQLTPATLTSAAGADYRRSFSRSGFDWVFDHDTTVIDSNKSATTQRLTSGSSINVAELSPASVIALTYFPNGVTPNTRLVALGIGQRCSLVPKTLNQAPVYPGCDGKYYGHYIAIFQVFASGERAVLVGVVDSYGRTTNYTIQQYNESLPDGSRQG